MLLNIQFASPFIHEEFFHLDCKRANRIRKVVVNPTWKLPPKELHILANIQMPAQIIRVPHRIEPAIHNRGPASPLHRAGTEVDFRVARGVSRHATGASPYMIVTMQIEDDDLPVASDEPLQDLRQLGIEGVV